MTFKQTLTLALTDDEISAILDTKALMENLCSELHRLGIYEYKYVDRGSLAYAVETLQEILDASDLTDQDV